MIPTNRSAIEYMLGLVDGQLASYTGRTPADPNNKRQRGTYDECEALVRREHAKPKGQRYARLIVFSADDSMTDEPLPNDWPQAPNDQGEVPEIPSNDEQGAGAPVCIPTALSEIVQQEVEPAFVQTEQIKTQQIVNNIKPDLSEARRLLDAGLHLVKLIPNSKIPEGTGWNKPEARAKSIDPDATGYGMPLTANNRCSVDPDNWALAKIGMAALGFDLDGIMESGVRTTSTRTGSGGRSSFSAEPDLSWIKFASRDPNIGTIIEFRADAPNLQDAIPGVVYYAKDGEVCTQTYANARRLDDPQALPDKLLAWWQRCSTEIDFLHEQQRIFMEAIGAAPILSISTGRKGDKLVYAAPGHRTDFNAANKVPALLDAHRYGYDKKKKRYYPPTATGAPSIREIPGKAGLWQSDHASDPLCGTFDAWTANVVLNYNGDVEAAKKAFDIECGLDLIDISLLLENMSKPRQQPVEGSGSDYSGAGDSTNQIPSENSHSGQFDLDSCIVDLSEKVSADSIHPHIIEQLVPEGEVTLAAGHGAAGKSYVALKLCIHVALGLDFGHLKVQRKKVLFFSAEDDKVELQRRVAKICRSLGVDQSELVDWLCLIDASEMEPTLYRVNKRDEHLHTQVLKNLDAFVQRCDFGLVVIDNASDVFDGNEIMRAHVRGFIRTLRQRLARPKRAVILLAHVSKVAAHNKRAQGAGTDEDYSGSTAWHNSVRSRMSLDTDEKGISTLKHLKANKGTKATPVQFEWLSGAPTIAGTYECPGAALAETLLKSAQKQKDEDDKATIIEIIKDFDRRGERLTTSMHGSVTVFKALSSAPDFPKGLMKDRLNSLMRELERDGQVFRGRRQTSNRKNVGCFSCSRDELESAPNAASGQPKTIANPPEGST